MQTFEEQQALVLLSGGQDSVTCLGLALKIHPKDSIYAISFQYGQRHSVELDCAKELCNMYSIPHKIIDISFLADLVTSSLTGEGDVSKAHPNNKDLPASFVPNRNALFLTIAHAHAQEIGAKAIYAGMCETDFSGYPDCRRDFIDKLENCLNVGYDTSISIQTPLMSRDKAETFQLADSTGFLEHVIEGSHTCYNGDRSHRHEWGYGCGACPACQLRSNGFAKFKKQFVKEAQSEKG